MPLKTLKDIIIDEITMNGPMDVGRYMTLCLCHPEYGYYMRQDPFGVQGDFTTAPEISQLFGETIAAWVVQTWTAMGEPKRWTLLELGAGRGTLMADVLRTLKALNTMPECYSGCDAVLMDVSPVLQSVQGKTLQGYDVSWTDNLDDAPRDRPIIVIANEFFDALPVRQLVHSPQGWQERKVKIQDNDLQWCETACALDAGVPDSAQAVPYGTVWEFSPTRESYISEICDAIKARSGAALIVDYGELEHKAGESLHAIKDHTHVDPLVDSGEADLSANVNFKALEDVVSASSLNTEAMEQGQFLKAYGIEQRAAAVVAVNDDHRDDVEKALHRLTDSAQMGTRFKVMTIWGNKTS